MTVSLEQFVQYLTQSGLMSASEVSSFQDTLPPDRKPKDGEALARELVKANKLTKYQAQVVYQGKTKGLAFGEYRVLDKLGQGGMGVVLKAQHQRMDRIVAVKTIAGTALRSPDAAKRFYREVKAAAKLNHPNIVQAYDASEHEGIHYLVMEYVEGKDLAALVKEKGPLRIDQAVDYIIQAARGLQYAHKQGIVHRDIKPANLLLDKEGTVKILDMGLARIAGFAGEEDQDRLTASGQVMGTCDYMAPEQAVDTHHADARSDIYSLGCTIYRLLTGEVLYKKETLVQVLLSHQQAPIPSLCKARTDVSPQLDAVYQKMVAKRAEERYQTMTEAITALETCVGKSPLFRSGRGAGGEGGGEPTAAFQAEDNLSFLQGASPRRLATTSKKKVGHHADVPLSQQAVAAETSKQLSDDEKLLALPRKKKTLVVAVGLGLLGAAGIVVLAVLLRIRHPNGKQTTFDVPEGSQVTIGKDGQVDVDLPKGKGKIAGVKAPVPWQPGSGTPPPLAKPVMFAIEAANIQKQWAEYLGVQVEETNSTGINLVLIPPGEFEMGSTPEEVKWALEYAQKNNVTDKWYLERVPSEAPRHHVKITKPFYLAMYQVTQGEYEKVMGVNPSAFTEKQVEASTFKPPLPETEVKPRVDDRKKVVGKDTSRHPVETVNWDEATEFCRKLSAMPAERAARRVYRLPTEAEWEYACRAGTATRWYSGDDEAGLADVAWFNKNSGGVTHPVGEKKPNAWGLYDMSGNVGQWCADRFSADYYKQSPPSDPTGPPAGSSRVLRGGHWYSYASSCRSAFRHSYGPAFRNPHSGFRVVVGR